MKPFSALDQAVSYWLMPCPQAQQRFDALSRRAQSGLRGCTLDAHITLYSDRLDDEETSMDRLGQVAKAGHPILLSPRAIEAGREAFLAGRMPRRRYASASSPLTDLPTG